jgi:glutamine amidotransferase
MIAIIDYGAGNLRNVCKALEHVGAKITLTDNPKEIKRADKIVLPGVGAFADCLQNLKRRGLCELLHEIALGGKPFLGICVGMQLLFDVGEEMGEWEGLGLIEGRVIKFQVESFKLKVPHIGWNQVVAKQPNHPVLKDVTQNGYAYFVHSYHGFDVDTRHVVATTDYGYDFPSVVAKDNIWGIQFHPEKSQEVGLQMLKNFVSI